MKNYKIQLQGALDKIIYVPAMDERSALEQAQSVYDGCSYTILKPNHKTPIEEIIFRASSVGHIAQCLEKTGLTNTQFAELEKLQALKVTPMGLTAKQQEDFEKLSKLEVLSEPQAKKLADYNHRITTPKDLTEKQTSRIVELETKRDAPPVLGEGAKSYIKKIWLENERSFKDEIVANKYLNKGIEGEEDAISLMSDVDGVFYAKHEGRVTKGHLTGECDVQDEQEIILNKLIQKLKITLDAKSSYSPLTYMQACLNPLYEWQGHAYNYLYDTDVFKLCYCLVDCPPSVYAEEYKKFCFKNQIIDDALPEYAGLIEQFNKNMIYTNNPQYSKEERVKTFTFYRDKEKEATLLLALELAVEYYQTITLNM